MAVESFKESAREVLAGRTGQRLERQVAELNKWVDGVGDFKDNPMAITTLQAKAELIFSTTIQLDTVTKHSLGYSSEGKVKKVEGTLDGILKEGIAIRLEFREFTDKNITTGTVCGKEMSQDDAIEAWNMYGLPAQQVYSYAKFLESQSK